MGKLEQIKQDNPEWFKTKNNNEEGATVRNIPLRLTEYDGKYFCGVNLETKEDIKVYLRDIEQKNATAKRKRPEIEDFADPNNKRIHAKPGEAVMLFEGCYPENEEGFFNARWGNKISDDPQETKVIIADASLQFGLKKNNAGEESEYLLLRTVHPEHGTEVGDLDYLLKYLTKFLHPQAPGSNPFVYIRITDDVGDIEIIEVRAKKIDREDGAGKMSAAADESVEEFMKAEQSEIVKMLVEDPDVKIELIPSRVIFPGTATKENMLDLHPNAKKILKESFFIKNDSDNEQESPQDEKGSKAYSKYPELGFLKCCVAVRSHADGTPFFTHVKPLYPFNAAVSIKDIKGQNSGV